MDVMDIGTGNIGISPAGIAATASAVNECVKIVKRLFGLSDVGDIKASLAELQGKLLAYQKEYAELYEKYSDKCVVCHALEGALVEAQKKLCDYEARAADLARYRLVSVGKGFFAYALKEADAAGEPPHLLCADCVAKGVKGFLNAVPCGIAGDFVQKFVECSNCGRGIVVRADDFDAALRYV